MLKARTAHAGKADGLVTAPSRGHIFSGTSGEAASTSSLGCKIPTKASVEPGPVSSILPISKRRSSTSGDGFWILATFRTSVHTWRNAAGCTLMKICRFAPFFCAEASAEAFVSSTHQTICASVIQLWSPSLSRTHPVQDLVPRLHFVPFLPLRRASSTPTALSNPRRLASTPLTEIVLIWLVSHATQPLEDAARCVGL